MYFYYFIRSEAWRKKPYWRAVWQDMQTLVLLTTAISLLLHSFVWRNYSLLLLLGPVAYYIYAIVRPSVYCAWQKEGKKFFCAVYYDRSSYLGKNGVLVFGCDTKIIRTAKVRRCKNLDTPRTLLVKIADSGRYMLFNAEFAEGLDIGVPLKHVNLVNGDSCFIANSLLTFVLNNGEIVRLPNVTEYKVITFLPEHDEETLRVTDYLNGGEPLPTWRPNTLENWEMNFNADYPYTRFLAFKQNGKTETLLRIDFSCVFIKQILRIEGFNAAETSKRV